jgi:hypothetical protein
MKESGKTIRWRALVDSTTKTEKSPTRDIGKMISSTDRVESTILNRLPSRKNSTTKISLS